MCTLIAPPWICLKDILNWFTSKPVSHLVTTLLILASCESLKRLFLSLGGEHVPIVVVKRIQITAIITSFFLVVGLFIGVVVGFCGCFVFVSGNALVGDSGENSFEVFDAAFGLCVCCSSTSCV